MALASRLSRSQPVWQERLLVVARNLICAPVLIQSGSQKRSSFSLCLLCSDVLQ